MKRHRPAARPIRVLERADLAQVIGGVESAAVAIKDHVENPSNTPRKD
jgi:hypothetical protein